MVFIARFFLLVLLLSFGELWLLIEVAQSISLLPTLLLCVLTGVLGGGMVRMQGFRTWRDIQQSLARGQAPAREIVSGLILIVIGTLLLTPGFITDTVAFLLLIPPLRNAAAVLLVGWFKRKVTVQTFGANGFGGGFRSNGFAEPPRQNHSRDPENIIIETEARED